MGHRLWGVLTSACLSYGSLVCVLLFRALDICLIFSRSDSFCCSRFLFPSLRFNVVNLLSFLKVSVDHISFTLKIEMLPNVNG